VMKVLEKEPAARYRTADQLGRVLINYNRPDHATSAAPAAQRPAPAPGNQAPPQRPPAAVQAPARRPAPGEGRPPARQVPVQPDPFETVEAENPLAIDWLTWFLALVMLVVGGLVPFWLWIYLLYNPPH
jgi:eukaryotic-like serine/threonine-protein kinase